VVFASNATDALNLAILGLAEPGCHVVSTRLEHNSVLRPLHHLKTQGLIDYDLVGFDKHGRVDPDDIAKAIRAETRFVIVNHASNVIGSVQDVSAIAAVCRERGKPLVLDVAQSAGVEPIDMAESGISAVAFTGHKSLLGPTGIGGLVFSDDLEIQSTRFGGTGVESQSLIHTQSYPHRLEAGTLNLLGIIGLDAGLGYLEELGIENIRRREVALAARLSEAMAGLDGLELYGPRSWDDRIAVILFNIRDMTPEDAGSILDGDFDIAVRTGLQCAPLAHQDLGTFPTGAVRISLGPFNTEEDIDSAIDALERIAKLR
jgi:cysteine desulfurase family protein